MSPLPPTKYGGTFFVKKLCMGSKRFGANLWRMFYMGTNDQIMQEGKLPVKRFQRSGQVSFPLIDPHLGY